MKLPTLLLAWMVKGQNSRHAQKIACYYALLIQVLLTFLNFTLFVMLIKSSSKGFNSFICGADFVVLKPKFSTVLIWGFCMANSFQRRRVIKLIVLLSRVIWYCFWFGSGILLREWFMLKVSIFLREDLNSRDLNQRRWEKFYL